MTRDELRDEIARVIGNKLYECGRMKKPAGDPWTDGPCLLAADAILSISKIAEGIGMVVVKDISDVIPLS
jgi:hypothetical protein